MKKIWILVFGVVMAAACTTEPYESGDGDLSYLRSDFGVAVSDAGKKLVSFTTDNDQSILFSKPVEQSWVTTADSLYRVLVYYNADGGSTTNPIAVGQVSVLRPKSLKKGEAMKSDPVNWTCLWLSTNRKYINLGMELMVGTTDKEDLRQVIGLVENSITRTATGHNHYHYTFYHSQNGVPEYYSQEMFVSVPTEGYTAGDSISIKINTYDGTKEKALVID